MGDRSTDRRSSERLVTVFRLSGERFAVGTETVEEITHRIPTTPVPGAPEYLEGLGFHRGSIIPVIETGRRIGVPPGTQDRRFMLVIGTDAGPAGLLADDLDGVLPRTAFTSEPPERAAVTVERRFVRNLLKPAEHGGLVVELDPGELCAVAPRPAVSKRTDSSGTGRGTAGTMQAEFAPREPELRLLAAAVSDEEYGFPLSAVREVLRAEELTRVPETRGAVAGVLETRGRLVPVLGLRTLFGLPSHAEELVRELDELKTRYEGRLAERREGRREPPSFEGLRTACARWIEELSTGSREFAAAAAELEAAERALSAAVSGVSGAGSGGTGHEPGAADPDGGIESAAGRLFEALGTLTSAVPQAVIRSERVVVLEADGIEAGVLVDRLHGVVRIPDRSASTGAGLPGRFGGKLRDIVRIGPEKRVIFVADERKLLEAEFLRRTQDGEVPMEDGGEASGSRERYVRLLVFTLRGGEYCIGIREVREVLRPEAITPVPKAPRFVAGVTNLRGEPVPVIDLGVLFGLGETGAGADPQKRIIVIRLGAVTAGLAVETVSEVLRVPERAVIPPPETLTGGTGAEFITGICTLEERGRFVMVIDTEKILSRSEREAFEAGQYGAVKPHRTRTGHGAAKADKTDKPQGETGSGGPKRQGPDRG